MVSGGAIYAEDNTVLGFTNGTNQFINNTTIAGGVIFIGKSIFSFSIRAISKAPLVFDAGIYLVNNGEKESDTLGGRMYIEVRSTFSILPNTTVYWENNHTTRGGAIYVEDFSSCNSYVPKEDCFFQLPGQNLSSRIDVQLVFKNNSADDAGNVLYGGAIDSCTLTGMDSRTGLVTCLT